MDVAADANLGVNVGGGAKVPGNFIDSVHMNTAAQGLLAALVRSTVSSLPF